MTADVFLQLLNYESRSKWLKAKVPENIIVLDH